MQGHRRELRLNLGDRVFGDHGVGAEKPHRLSEIARLGVRVDYAPPTAFLDRQQHPDLSPRFRDTGHRRTATQDFIVGVRDHAQDPLPRQHHYRRFGNKSDHPRCLSSPFPLELAPPKPGEAISPCFAKRSLRPLSSAEAG